MGDFTKILVSWNETVNDMTPQGVIFWKKPMNQILDDDFQADILIQRLSQWATNSDFKKQVLVHVDYNREGLVTCE